MALGVIALCSQYAYSAMVPADSDGDGLYDTIELWVLEQNPSLLDDDNNPVSETVTNTYLDDDGDAIPNIIEQYITSTDPSVDDQTVCAGGGGVVLTGMWDVRISPDLTQATNFLTDKLKGISFCHTAPILSVFDPQFGYADTASFTNGPPYPRTLGMEVGRGQAIDAANYAAQCCLACPMRQGAQPQPITVASKGPKTSASDISPGVTVNSPADNGIFLPGDTLPVDVDVDPALQATRLLVYLGQRSQSPSEPVEILGPPFTGNVLLPNDYAGALYFDILLVNDVDQAVGIAELNINLVPSEVPSQIEALDRTMYLHFPEIEPEPVRHISVFGTYPDGTRRDLTEPMLGTTYSSNNSSVVTVDVNGIVTPVAEGTAYITIEHKGVKTFTEVIVGDTSNAVTEHTVSVDIDAGAFRSSPKTGRFVQQVSITNIGQFPMALPLQFVLDGLPPGVVLSNRFGETQAITPIGSPYILLETDERGFVSPGNTITVILEFLNFQGVPITYTPKVFTTINP